MRGGIAGVAFPKVNQLRTNFYKGRGGLVGASTPRLPRSPTMSLKYSPQRAAAQTAAINALLTPGLFSTSDVPLPWIESKESIWGVGSASLATRDTIYQNAAASSSKMKLPFRRGKPKISLPADDRPLSTANWNLQRPVERVPPRCARHWLRMMTKLHQAIQSVF